MKELYSFAEVAPLLDQGSQLSFTRTIQAQITVKQLPDSERINAIFLLSLGQYNITTFEMEYEDIAELLETFDIDDSEEIWEVAE